MRNASKKSMERRLRYAKARLAAERKMFSDNDKALTEVERAHFRLDAVTDRLCTIETRLMKVGLNVNELARGLGYDIEEVEASSHLTGEP